MIQMVMNAALAVAFLLAVAVGLIYVRSDSVVDTLMIARWFCVGWLLTVLLAFLIMILIIKRRDRGQ